MATIHISNIGELFTGDIAAPMAQASSLLIENGQIVSFDPPAPQPGDRVLDLRGGAVMPGLVDGHVHPVLGEWTPTQDAIGWIGNYLHGGTTTMVSAGELHVPGIDYLDLTPELVTSLAIVTASTTGRVRWSGVRLHAGCVLLVPGMREEHFDRLAKVGTRLAKFIFYPFSDDHAEARRYVDWCHQRNILVKVHTGGVSRSGANRSCGYDILSWLQPDIAAHVSGGPIPMKDGDIDAVVDNTSFALEVCSSGNFRSTLRAVRRLADKQRLDRLTVGTDTPSGTGVLARGMLQMLLFLTSVCGLTPGEAVAAATGNTARAHGLDVGILAPGRPADIVVCGPIQGSSGATLTETLAHGDLPGISHVITEGNLVLEGRSRITPPPMSPAKLYCCGNEGSALMGGSVLLEGRTGAHFRCD
ncbi:MAG: amidohydrolase family protein [Hyphomicrobiales bacterium]|nr:amidohydrolase family protein [Hyphomicrobiales bacterium]